MYDYYYKCLDFKTIYQSCWSLASAPVRFQKRFLLYHFMYNISRSLETLPNIHLPMRMFQLFSDNSNFFLHAKDVRQNGFAFSHLPDYKTHTFQCRHIKWEKHKLWKGKQTWFISWDIVLRSETGLVATRALDLLQHLGSITCLLWTAWTRRTWACLDKVCVFRVKGWEGWQGSARWVPGNGWHLCTRCFVLASPWSCLVTCQSQLTNVSATADNDCKMFCKGMWKPQNTKSGEGTGCDWNILCIHAMNISKTGPWLLIENK